MKLPLLLPSLPDAARLRPWLERIDAARRYTNFGPLNDAFERQIAAAAGAPHTAAVVATVANATLGLELALQSFGLPPGARIAVPALTFVASATAIRRAGFEPVICDVDERTWCLTPELAAHAVAACGARAVLPVAAFGAALDTDAWDAFAERCSVPVLVDAAGAFGSQRIGRQVDVVYSFHATKSFGIGEGGAVASGNAGRIARLRRATNFGIDLATGTIDECGTNAKLSEYHAAVGLAAFETWEAVRHARAALAAAYRAALRARCPWLGFQQRESGAIDALLPVTLPDTLDIVRTISALAARGIETRRWYCPPLHRHPALRDCPRAGSLPNAERLGMRLLGLPFFLGMGEQHIDYVCDALADAARNAA